MGVGGAFDPLEARTSWSQARAALRFAAAGSPRDAVADHDELGPVALLADIPVERLRAQEDVRRLGRLARGERGERAGHGGELLAALAAFCRTGSLRQAAGELHLHHSSVAARLTHVEKELGWRLRDPQDRFRAQLALYALRLADGGEDLGGG
ncbi:helix-turn-helix domain-containing protein [Streptomyces pristinaespiralis]|uniref:helix-turn-helix domain-containing protein n=1 Tax=Streptomyces pristinaespiralis TaxID=38300 RepID=UPI001F39A532|nr:helix-turn-helix domain-containing protein [Streptomyces pristinaespiralis]